MKFISLLIVMILSFGCGAQKMAVENADSLIKYQVTKRLPLYSSQKDQLSKDIDKLLIDSKPMAQEIIPVLDDLDLNSSDSLDAQYPKLEKFYKNIAKNFSGLMSKYMAMLDQKQQKDFFETLDDENREILKKEKEDRIDHVEDRFEMFLGSVNSKQKQLIRDYSDYFEARAKKRLKERIELHSSFRNIYAQDISESSRSKSFQEEFTNYQEESLSGNKNLEFLKKVIPTLTASQKEYFRKQVQEVKSLLKYFNSIEY